MNLTASTYLRSQSKTFLKTELWPPTPDAKAKLGAWLRSFRHGHANLKIELDADEAKRLGQLLRVDDLERVTRRFDIEILGDKPKPEDPSAAKIWTFERTTRAWLAMQFIAEALTSNPRDKPLDIQHGVESDEMNAGMFGGEVYSYWLVAKFPV